MDPDRYAAQTLFASLPRPPAACRQCAPGCRPGSARAGYSSRRHVPDNQAGHITGITSPGPAGMGRMPLPACGGLRIRAVRSRVINNESAGLSGFSPIVRS